MTRRDGFTAVTFEGLRSSLLGGCLVPVVDAVRDIATQLGARPYEVALVHTRWSGGVRNDGTESVASREVIVPTPLVRDHNNLTNTLQSNGLDELGLVRVSEISLAYTEDCLLGRDANGLIADDLSFYYEVTVFLPDGAAIHRRFMPRSVPHKDSENLQWTIDLLRTTDDRTRAGDPT